MTNIGDAPKRMLKGIAEMGVILTGMVLMGMPAMQAETPTARRLATLTVDGNPDRTPLEMSPVWASKQAGNLTFLRAGGRRLAVTAGTAETTRLVKPFKDIGSPMVEHGLPVGETLWFPVWGWELDPAAGGIWRTDGTLEGTYQLSGSAFNVSTADVTPEGVYVVLHDDDFFGSDTKWKFSLVSRDGKTFDDLATGSGYNIGMRRSDDGYWLIGEDQLQHWSKESGQLETLDGKIKLQSAVRSLAKNNELYLVANEAIWVSRGTRPGSVLEKLAAFADAPYSYGSRIVDLGDEIVFTVMTEDEKGYALWRTDGTSEGTTPIPGSPSVGSSKPQSQSHLEPLPGASTLIVDGDHTLFVDITGTELWSYGSGEFTLKARGMEIVWPTPLDETVYFVDQGGRQLRRLGETPDSSIIVFETAVDEDPALLILGASDSFGQGNPTSPFFIADGELHFIENHVNKKEEGFVLDDSDLRRVTNDSTVIVASLESAVPTGTDSSDLKYLATWNGLLFWKNCTSDNRTQIWCDDVGEGRTQVLGEFTSALFVAQDSEALYFSVPDQNALWKTSGHPEDTVKVANLSPGTGVITPDGVLVYEKGGRIITFSLKNGETESLPLRLAYDPFRLVGEKVFVEAKTASTWRNALWVLEGNSLTELATLNDGFNFNYHITAAKDGVYFFSRERSNGPVHIWFSDGTEQGTRSIVELPESKNVINMVKMIGDHLWFALGKYLWKSDGTAEGTFKVHQFGHGITAIEPMDGEDVAVFVQNGHSTDFFKVRPESQVTFVAEIGSGTPIWFEHAFWFPLYNSAALWRSDGTPQGTGITNLETDVPGTLLSGAARFEEPWFAATKDRLYLTLQHASTGVELWAIDRSGFDRWREPLADPGSRLIPDDRDSDGDGTTDLMEFVFDTDPSRKTDRPSIKAENGIDQDTFTVRFPPTLTDVGIDLSIETSNDLEEWVESVRIDESGLPYPGKEPLSDVLNEGRRDITLKRPPGDSGHFRLRFTVR